MITALANGAKGERIVLLGVSRENVNRLMRGLPIRVTAESHPGFPADLVIAITFGETEKDITQQLEGLISPDTKVVGVPREKGTPS